MKVTEFFLGFGPKLWSFQRGETEYGVKAIPAGALRPHHRDEQPRRGPARGRAPHVSRAVVSEATARRRRRVGHALHPGVAVHLPAADGHRRARRPRVHAGVRQLEDRLGHRGRRREQGRPPARRHDRVGGRDRHEFVRQAARRARPRAASPSTSVIDHNGQRLQATTVLGTDATKGLLGIKIEQLPEPTKRSARCTPGRDRSPSSERRPVKSVAARFVLLDLRPLELRRPGRPRRHAHRHDTQRHRPAQQQRTVG